MPTRIRTLYKMRGITRVRLCVKISYARSRFSHQTVGLRGVVRAMTSILTIIQVDDKYYR